MTLQTALDALGDPIRRSILRELSAEPDFSRPCGTFHLPVSKAAASHHFAVLRAAGLLEQLGQGPRRFNRLRRAEFEARFPGLLVLVLNEEEANAGEQLRVRGFDGSIGRVAVGLEAAHVRWWAFHGCPDELANALCLCSLHHRLFDRGAGSRPADHRLPGVRRTERRGAAPGARPDRQVPHRAAERQRSGGWRPHQLAHVPGVPRRVRTGPVGTAKVDG